MSVRLRGTCFSSCALAIPAEPTNAASKPTRTQPFIPIPPFLVSANCPTDRLADGASRAELVGRAYDDERRPVARVRIERVRHLVVVRERHHRAPQRLVAGRCLLLAQYRERRRGQLGGRA